MSLSFKDILFTSVFVFFGLLMIFISFVWFSLAWSESKPILICMCSIFFLIGLFLLWLGVMSVLELYTRLRVGEPKIEISSSLLGVGEGFTVSYFHIFNNPLNVKSIHVELLFRETATYRQGTNTKRVSHEEIVMAFEDPGGNFEAKSVIEKSHEFQIPPNGMHSLAVKHNKLQWFIRFQLNMANLNLKNEYELQVLPEMR